MKRLFPFSFSLIVILFVFSAGNNELLAQKQDSLIATWTTINDINLNYDNQ